MNSLILSVILTCCALYSSGQDAQFGENKISYEPYVGIPNNANYLLYRSYSGDDTTVSNYHTIGTPVLFGFRGEFPSTNRMSIGFDINYEESGFKYSYADSLQHSTSYNLTYKATKLRLMLKGSYYFLDRTKLRASINANLGYRYIKRFEKSNDPNHIEKYSENSIPIAGRVAICLKYYPVVPIGIFVEVGAFGGSIIQTGLSFRL